MALPEADPGGEFPGESDAQPDRSKEVRRAAMDLLARREHSQRELNDKLLRRFGDAAAVAAAVNKLREERLQSDDRFAEAFVHSRAQSFYGPLRIAQELRQRGVEEAIASAALHNAAIDWFSNLQQLQRNRFGGAGEEVDLRERARRQRFLQYRGFSPEQIRQLERGEE